MITQKIGVTHGFDANRVVCPTDVVGLALLSDFANHHAGPNAAIFHLLKHQHTTVILGGSNHKILSHEKVSADVL
jgi:hypothetical protein